jgi:hypothetical protein
LQNFRAGDDWWQYGTGSLQSELFQNHQKPVIPRGVSLRGEAFASEMFFSLYRVVLTELCKSMGRFAQV